MSHISVKDFAEIRKSVTNKRQEISEEINSKKTISKNQCLQWIDDICDLVICYDPILSLTSPSIQPFIKLVDINSNKDSNSATEMNDSSEANGLFPKEDDNNSVVIEEEEDTQTVAKSSASDSRPAKDGVRFKGVIRGFDSLKNGGSDDDWNETPKTSKSPPKKSKTTRKTRSQSSKQQKNNKTNDKKEDANEWSTGGQVLGGDTPSTASSLSQDEKRRLLAEKSEQRLAQMTKRGSKGVVRLPTRAQADIDEPNDRNSKLQWKI